jgi:hypothetical protein
MDSINSTAKKNHNETIHEKDPEPKIQDTVSEESIRSLSGSDLFNSLEKKMKRKRSVLSKKSSMMIGSPSLGLRSQESWSSNNGSPG